jgi:CCR4-NOT transcriptional regulation complex NOT5 subunit
MNSWHIFVARLIGAIGSWVDASNLRNRVYLLEDQRVLLKTALEDVVRMDRNGKIAKYAQEALERAESLRNKL